MGVMNRLNVQRAMRGDAAQAYVRVVMETQKLLLAVDAKRRKVLFQTGGYARTTMYRSLNKTAPKKARNANRKRPPYTHRTKNGHAGALARLVGFQVSEKDGSFVAGPNIANFQSKTVPITARTIPELLDKGGRAMLPQGPANYREFPYVQPAFDKALDKFKERIANLPLLARR